MNSKLNKYIVFFVISVIAIIFQGEKINEFPQYKHSWAQCDRYAISIGFIDNGGDFFHPQTYVLNNQFPGNFSVARNTTVTSVDFPVHDYIASILMRIFHTTDPWCFKLYVLIYSLIGLFYLYKITTLYTDSVFRSLIVVFVVASSPIFLYYQAGFLPTMPSLSNTFIALYFFLNYLKNYSKKSFIISVVFVTLATLSRLPFAIILTSLICFEFFYLIKNRRVELYKIVSFVLSIAIIFSYYMYNSYLRNKYGSLFLNSLVPASDFSELKDIIKNVYERWSHIYFSVYSYVLLGIFILLFIFRLLFKKNVVRQEDKKIFLLLGIIWTGALMYFMLMAKQFLYHDYYFLDTFFIPFVLTFLFFVIKSIAVFKKNNIYMEVLVLALFIPIFINANSVLKLEEQLSKPLVGSTTAENFKNSQELLDKLKVPVDAKMLVLCSDGPNNPLILMKRKGYASLSPAPLKVENALKFPFDFVVIENLRIINDLYNSYPEILNKLELVGSDGLISIFRKKVSKTDISAASFFGLTLDKLLLKDHVNFDTIAACCPDLGKLSDFHYSGTKSGFVDPSTEYGFGYHLKNMNLTNNKYSVLHVKSLIYGDTLMTDFLLSVSINSKGNNLHFFADNLSKKNKKGEWILNESFFIIPKIEEDIELSVFYWNKGKNTVFYDDFDISLYHN